MKKPTWRLRFRILIRRRREARRQRTLEHKKRVRLGLETPRLASRSRSARLYLRGHEFSARQYGTPFCAPEVLSLGQNYEASAAFLQRVRRYLDQQEPKLLGSKSEVEELSLFARKVDGAYSIGPYPDLRHVRDLRVPTALVLASEYDRIVHFSGGRRPGAIDLHRWNPNVLGLMRAIGFFELAGVEPQEGLFTNLPNSRILKMRSGNKVHGETIYDALHSIGIDILRTEDPRLNSAIVEAITNTVHHAYKYKEWCDTRTLENWWITAELRIVNEGRRILSIAVYDQGASIPRTLPRSRKFAAIKAKLLSWLSLDDKGPSDYDATDARHDGLAVLAALEVGRSSTGDGYRGKGLADVMAALDLCDAGSVTIYSRCGVVTQNRGETPFASTVSTPLTGTLILWHLTLPIGVE